MNQTTPVKRKPQATKATDPKVMTVPSRGANLAEVLFGRRGWLLTVWLVLLTLLAAVSTLTSLVPFNFLGAVLGAIQVGLVVGLWLWRRWAFYAIVAVGFLAVLAVGVLVFTTHRFNYQLMIMGVIVVVGTVEAVNSRLARFK